MKFALCKCGNPLPWVDVNNGETRRSNLCGSCITREALDILGPILIAGAKVLGKYELPDKYEDNYSDHDGRRWVTVAYANAMMKSADPEEKVPTIVGIDYGEEGGDRSILALRKGDRLIGVFEATGEVCLGSQQRTGHQYIYDADGNEFKEVE
ncbi:hypothetical protein LCGC14_0470430 [marine sediment metagenome]|uniref:Uncharacterized protein n=1 Tax=marine sediment metagenome TaxID=412755 RepID=A0A0F9SHG5_9ZZZZ